MKRHNRITPSALSYILIHTTWGCACVVRVRGWRRSFGTAEKHGRKVEFRGVRASISSKSSPTPEQSTPNEFPITRVFRRRPVWHKLLLPFHRDIYSRSATGRFVPTTITYSHRRRPPVNNRRTGGRDIFIVCKRNRVTSWPIENSSNAGIRLEEKKKTFCSVCLDFFRNVINRATRNACGVEEGCTHVTL